MKITTYITSFIVATSVGFISTPSQGASLNEMSSKMTKVASADSHIGKGKVLVIDKKLQRIKLAHGPIKSLNWGPMKMFFATEKAELLNDIKVGDSVNFRFIKANDGRFVIIGFD